jgi:hypothetical protein
VYVLNSSHDFFFLLKYLQGDQPWLDNGHYWDDFFLLKVNAKYLLEELERTYLEKPAILKVLIICLFLLKRKSICFSSLN